jgi:sugar phosphate isomerase/epimerase
MSKHLWPVGTIVGLSNLLHANDEENREGGLQAKGGAQTLRAMGLDTCQITVWDPAVCTDENAEKALEALDGFPVMTAIVGWPGPAEWNFYGGPRTLGLIPDEYREIRMDAIMKEMAFFHKMGVPLVCTHVGFIPEDPNMPLYKIMVDCLKKLGDYAGELGQIFCLETGQETPITLRRAIEDSGSKNLGINFDTANLLMYGKANPADAVDVFGMYVRSMHIKDGEYPTNVHNLGEEVPVGKGRADFQTVLQKLHNIGFNGPLIIEREISGPQQTKDIETALSLLEGWMANIH